MGQLDYLRTRARALESLFGDALPHRLGRNRVTKKLGEGAMGVVYLAVDPSLGRECAVKVLHECEADADRRLLREARALAALSHPNVVQIYEITTYERRTCIVMEYVHGPTLRAWLADQRRTTAEILEVFVAAGDGLAAAHARGLVHRDFKPDNVLIGTSTSGSPRDVRPRVVDFGLARPHAELRTPAERWESPSQEPAASTWTVAGARIGTPVYMAPEQLEGAETDARCDQYAFCVSLYEALQGVRPFAGRTATALLHAKRHERPVWPRGAAHRLRALVERGLAPDPADRFPDMNALLERLRSLGIRRRGPTLALAASTILAVATVAILAQESIPARCESGASSIAAVWNDSRSSDVTSAFSATGLPYAADADARVRTSLDDYADRWARAYDEVCASAQLVGAEAGEAAVDARMTCLRRQRESLRGLVDGLVNADATVVERAAAVTERMASPDDCAQMETSESSADPQRRATLDALHVSIAAAQTEQRLGHFDAAWQLATKALLDAREASDAGLLAEALFIAGSIADERGAYAEAEAMLREADALAIEAGRDDIAARAAIELLLVVGERQERGAMLEDLARTAEAALQRAGDPPALRMRFHEFLGAAMRAHGRYPESIRHLDAALASANAELGPESSVVASLSSSAGLTRVVAGVPLEALAMFDRAESIWFATSPQHPNHAGNLTNRANAYLSLGRFDEAAADLRAALEIKTKVFGPAHPRLRSTLAGLAQTLDRQERFGEELVYASWGFAVVSAHPEVGDDRDSATSMIAWGLALYHLDRLDEAESAFQRAAVSMRALDHPQLAPALVNLANIAERRGDHAKAERLAEEGLAISEASLSATAPMVGSILRFRGKIREKLGRHEEADADLHRALAIAERHDDEPSILSTLTLLAELETSRNRPAAAAAYVERRSAIEAIAKDR